jgi:CubicO group peptidase (beta-lactamase class C family)
MNHHPFRLVFVLFFFGCFGCHAQSNETPATDTQAKIMAVENNLSGLIRIDGQPPWTLKERMAFYKLLGLSIAVIHDYKLAWAKGYGWADDSMRIPVTTQTLFQAASISKSINAVGVLKLVQENKLDLNTDINQYLTSWKFPYDSVSKGKKITVVNLLSHTAGLTVHGFPGYERGTALPTLVQILNGVTPANSPAIRSMFEPGLRSEYSGGGITISQQLVMDITHQPYAQFMISQVLQPLGMVSSSYDQPNLGVDPKLLATGYTMSGKAIPGKYHIYPEQAAAGLWTNPTDLASYIIETQLALEGKSQKVLNQQMTRLRLTPYLDKSAALGVFITGGDSANYFQHGGANEGFRSQYFGSLEGGEGVVVMVNSDNGDILQEIINSVAKVYEMKGLSRTKVRKTIAVNTGVLETYTGKYQLNPNLILTVTRSGDQLFVQATHQPQVLLYPEAQNKFFLTVVDAELEFVKDEKDQVVKVKLFQNGQIQEATKIN